ncbi:DUF4430 domain-containing protein [Halobacillus litoralis]|uniref:DUF4430 domain-containing protein n=1 Tax=Halobacillus litoralis TaxID=45668 RepID=UPI001CFD4DA4|nr:DUF4430 domain-containing protein [Halobacillus litoralis]
MGKWYSFLLAAVITAGVLAGCGAQEEMSNTSQEEVKEVTVQVELSKKNGEEVLADEQFTVEEGTTLMELMEENFEVEQTDGFINSIEGVAGNQEEKMAWMYTVNGEEATVGANEYEVKEGDDILFDYHSWE